MPGIPPPSDEVRFTSAQEAHAVLGPVMEAVAAAVGPHCEVVLHDLSSGMLDHTILAIVNGHVSGRTVGGPSTNLGVEVLHDESGEHNAFGYRAYTSDGRELISSSVYYRDPDGHIIVALCVNVDLSPAQTALNALSSLLPVARTDSPQPRELLSPDVSTILEGMIAEALADVGKPVPTMDKADRIGVLRTLEERGAFRIKRAADAIAGRLGVSRVTIYGYLDEIRRG